LNYLRQSVFGLIVVGLICAVGMYALIQAHVHTIYGGRVEIADYRSFEKPSELTAIVNVNVLAPEGDRMLPERTVVLDQGLIVSIEASGAEPSGARVIDGRNQFLIPGLIDGHVHLRRQPNDLLLYVANGITQVRQLSGRPEDLSLKQDIERGRIGPALYVASPSLFSAGRIEGAWTAMTRPALNVRHAGRAEAVIDDLIESGYDAIKTYDNLDLESFQRINVIARERDIYTLGHLPVGFDLNTLADIELAELAHIEELIKKLLDEFTPYYERGGHGGFLRFVEQRTPRIVSDLLEAGTAVNTTLWFMDTLEHQAGDLVGALKQIPLEYANPGMVEGSRYAGMGWLPGMNRFQLPPDLDPDIRDNTVEFWRTRAEAHKVLLRALAAGNVPITLGTDATVEGVVPGFSLHQELITLQQSGLSPQQALASATLTLSDLMGTNGGSIAPGHDADLVLLSANPLLDIGNTALIDTVILDGRILDRTTLDGMLSAVRSAHANSRNFDLSRYQ